MTENGLEKRKALVTGSTQGIGKAIAAALVKSGYSVTVHCSRDAAKAERVRAEIGADATVTCDLSDLSETRKLFEKTGRADVLVLCASVQYKEPWTDVCEETLESQITVNFKSTLVLMQEYYPAMKERGFGRIITIGSANQHRTHRELSVYAATKCAVMSLVKNVAKEAAPFGVTVNNVSPGAIATPRNAAVYADEEKRRAVESAIPAGRFGTPEDCVAAVLMLASDEACYVTGADLSVDGGMSL